MEKELPIEIPKNGRRVRNGSPESVKILELRDACKAAGIRYPNEKVDSFYDYPFFWWNRVAYREGDFHCLVPSKVAKSRPLELPDHWIINGESRLPGEPIRQYELYLAYRDLGPDRTFTKLGAATPSIIRNRSYLSYATRFRWDERCAAYDAQMEIEARRAAQALLHDQMKIEVTRRQTYLDNEWSVIEKGFEVVGEMLKYPVVEQRSVKVTDEGKTIVTIWQPGKWTMATVASMIDTLAKVGRLHTGMSTSNAAIKSDPMAQERMRAGQEAPQSAEDAEMHAYASMRAEEEYFRAIDEYKERRKNQPGIVGAPTLTARVRESEAANAV